MKRGKLSENYVNSDSEYEESTSQESVKVKVSNKSSQESKEVPSPPKSNSDEPIFELSGKRRVTVRKFRSSTLIDIREYYEDKASGEDRPGKKGISLTRDQYEKLKELLPEIDAAVNKMK